MLLAWLNQPTWLQLLVLVVGYGAVALLLFRLTFGRRSRAFAQSLAGLSPSYFAVPATLFALLAGFVANDAWERERQATRVVQSESDNVLAIYELSRQRLGSDAVIRDALQAYLEAVVASEWPAMATGSSSAEADAALDELFRQVAGSKPEGSAPGPASGSIQSALLNLALKIRSDRGARLALNEHQTDGPKWLTLLVLGVLTQVAIAVVHIDRPRAHVVAMAIFTTALVATLGLVAIHEWPFDGPAAVRPVPLVKAAERLQSNAAHPDASSNSK